MKQKLLLYAFLGAAFVLLESFGNPFTKTPQGSPGGYTGSPGDGQNCTSCHGGSAVPVNGWITSNVPVSGYIPGNTYTITVTASGSGNKGFEVSPQTVNGALLGSLTAGAGNQLANSNKSVTHTQAVNANPAVWNFNWTAPATGAGNVTFYGAIVVGKPNVKLCTLVIPESTTGLAENDLPYLSVFPNVVKESLNFEVFLPKTTKVTAAIYSITGNYISTVISETLSSGKTTKTLEISANLHKGVYILKTQGEGFSMSKKFIIQ
ncbi:MAG: choice-of-anchor V domain-containing protein [Bacteroidales bacterium]